VPDLRVDILTGDQVIVAPGRATRPDTFRVPAAPALPAAVATCPFCPGNEHETPPEVFRTGPGAPDTPGWRVRVVPNLYPILPGAHEVVILSPAHDHSLAQLDDGAARELFQVMRDRVVHHVEVGCAYVQAFVNHGRAAGASIEHPHGQVIGLSEVPPRVAALTDCLDAAVDEVRGTPLLLRDNDVVVWSPPAAITPSAVRIALPAARARFEQCDDDTVGATALATRDAVRAIDTVFGDVSYNVVVQQGPRWWVDIVPRMTVRAGFELGTGLHVNPVRPEDAAEALREAL